MWALCICCAAELHHETHVSSEDSGLQLDDIYTLKQENVVFGRIETQAARQVMLQKVREAEREKIVEQFRAQNNKLVSGSVKRVTRDNIIVDIGNDVEAILPRDQLLPGEIYKINDRIRAVLQIKEIVRQNTVETFYTWTALQKTHPCHLRAHDFQCISHEGRITANGLALDQTALSPTV